jgi:cobalt-precorrin-5B (C1)-methyltransferase
MIELRGGYTTGACAAAAAKAAAALLCGAPAPETVEITLPDGETVAFPIISCRCNGTTAEASVRKDAGDDPDVTHQSLIVAAVTFTATDQIEFAAGEGVGIVTKPGLSARPGEPAINPVPRQMITEAVRAVTPRGVRVTVSIPGGRELAERTFNPRLGVVGGLSIIGTTGRVRPFSAPGLQASLRCALAVAAETGVRDVVLVPGNIGEGAAKRHLRVSSDQIVHVSTEWGFMLDEAACGPFANLLALGHPGKLAKLIVGDWDTHSSRSQSATPTVMRVAAEIGFPVPESTTVEGIFNALPSLQREPLANALAVKIRFAIVERIGTQKAVAVAVIDMAGDILGSAGDLTQWQ